MNLERNYEFEKSTVIQSVYISFIWACRMQRKTKDDEQITTHSGDIVLYSGDKIVVFYGSNSWAYTRLGKMNIPEGDVTELLSNGDITLKIAIEKQRVKQNVVFYCKEIDNFQFGKFVVELKMNLSM